MARQGPVPWTANNQGSPAEQAWPRQLKPTPDEHVNRAHLESRSEYWGQMKLSIPDISR